jgi:hypothetical protein
MHLFLCRKKGRISIDRKEEKIWYQMMQHLIRQAGDRPSLWLGLQLASPCQAALRPTPSTSGCCQGWRSMRMPRRSSCGCNKPHSSPRTCLLLPAQTCPAPSSPSRPQNHRRTLVLAAPFLVGSPRRTCRRSSPPCSSAQSLGGTCTSVPVFPSRRSTHTGHSTRTGCRASSGSGGEQRMTMSYSIPALH